MPLLRRIITLLLILIGLLAAFLTGLALFFTRMLVRPPRQPLWETPDEYGLPFEDVQFPARDGLRLSGWFIPRDPTFQGDEFTTIIIVHGWPWNRLGTSAKNLFMDLPGASTVRFLPLVKALHGEGYQILMFDLRNHGQSASFQPYTFGLKESNDLLGALEYLAGRKDVNSNRLGVIGFSSGANTVLFSLPQTNQVRAAMVVQPTSPVVFSRRLAADLFGPFNRVLVPLIELFYRIAGGIRFAAAEPLFSTAGVGNVPVLYVQGKGDPWGSVGNVNQMAANTPIVADFLIVDSENRFGGYQYVIDNPHIAATFFSENIH
jgi:pimeloyl-ACP methyl ester carboxylesterase